MQNSQNTQKYCFCKQILKKSEAKSNWFCGNCRQEIGKGNDLYWCQTGRNCDFYQIMGYVYLLCSDCFRLISDSGSSSFELIKFSVNTINKSIKTKP